MTDKGVTVGDWADTISQNITFDRCIIDSNYPEKLTGELGTADASRGAADGFSTYTNAKNIILKNSIIKNWQHTNIAISGFENKIFNNDISGELTSYGAGITTHAPSRNADIYNNDIHDLHERQQLFGQNNHFHHNKIRNIRTSTIKSHMTGEGIWVQGGDEITGSIFEYNTIQNTDGPCIGMYPAANDVHHNIFRGNALINCGIKRDSIYIGIFLLVLSGE